MDSLRKYLIILLLICIGFLAWQNDWIFVNPFEDATIESLVYASRDFDGNTYIIEDSGNRMIKFNSENSMCWSTSGSHLSSAKEVLVDTWDNVYVHTIVNDDTGLKIKEDKILMYSSDGNYLDTMLDLKYEESIYRSKVVGLYMIGDVFVTMTKEGDTIRLYDSYGEIYKEYSYEGAQRDVFGAAVDSNDGTIYLLTYTGKIIKYVDGVNNEVIYDCTDSGEISVPNSISCAPNGTIYVSDIGTRQIFVIDKDRNITYLNESADFSDISSAYKINATYGFVGAASDAVKVYNGNDFEYISEIGLSGTYKAICISVWIVIAVAAILAVILGIMGMIYLTKKSGLYTKISIGVILGVAGVSSITFAIMLPQLKQRILDAQLSRISFASEVTADKIPLDELFAIQSPADYDGEHYKAVKKSVESVFLVDNENIRDLYCDLYTINDGIITSVYCTQEDTGAFYTYDWAYEDSDEQEILSTGVGKTYTKQSNEGSFLFVLNPIFDEDGNAVALIEVGEDLRGYNKDNNKIMLEMVINLVAITVVIILIAIEIIIYAQGSAKYESFVSLGVSEKIPIPNGILRLIVFIIFFVTNIATGFLPAYAMNLSSGTGIPGIPASVFAAIPISAEVVTGAIFSICGTKVIDWLGVRKAAIVSCILFTAGLFIRFIPNYWILTIGNAIMGIGWGIILLIVNTIIAEKDEEEKDRGFSDYNAAALNGVNCGVVFGGFLFNWFSYQVIFIATAVISSIVFLILRKYIKNETLDGSSSIDLSDEGSAISSMSTLKFLTRGKIISYFIMIVIPIIACGYFLNYLFPILGNEYGLSETNVSYAYLLNGICVMSCSTFLTESMGKRFGKKSSLVIASIIYAIAFIIVAKYQNIGSLFVALVMLGISDSFGLPIQTGYFTDLDEVKEYGYDKAMGVYSLFENAAQAAGSFVFSYALIVGVGTGLTGIAVVIATLAIIFLLVSIIPGSKKKNKAKEENAGEAV